MKRDFSLALVVTLGAIAAALFAANVRAAQATNKASGEVEMQKVTPHPGDICVECAKPIGPEDVTYLVNGQRVAVHRGACDAAFRGNPQPVLARLQPRGAFLGSGSEGQNLSHSWFVVGLYVLFGLIFGALCSQRALVSGRRPAFWFAGGFFFSIFAYGALLFLPKREVVAPAGVPKGLHKIAATYAPANCPVCGATVHPAATKCPVCGAALEPRVVSEVAKVGRTR